MYNAILLPIDLDQESSWEKAAPAAVSLARLHGIKIHVLTVLPDYDDARLASLYPSGFVEQAKESAKRALDEFAATHIPDDLLGGSSIAHGTIYNCILENADTLACDLIIMASHQPEKADFLLGPNAARVVRHAKQSVFVVR
jgi:nucleotide-binding universal stress UspA family protein